MAAGHYPNPHGPACPWHAFTERVGAPNLKWCEATQCAWLSEPANALSNAAYLVVALAVWRQCRLSPRMEVRRLPPLLLWVGLSSFLFHASNNYLSQLLDFHGMFSFSFWLLVINLRRARLVSRESQQVLWLGLQFFAMLVVHVLYRARIKYQWLIVLAIVGVLATEYLARSRSALFEQPGSLARLRMGVLLLLCAQLASLADLLRIACDPQHSWLHGHVAWHHLSAISLYYVVQHYRALPYEGGAR